MSSQENIRLLLTEHSNSARQTIQVTVTWFAFAVTVNLAAGGALIGYFVDKQDNITTLTQIVLLAIPVAAIFIFACCVSVGGLQRVSKSLESHNCAISRLTKIMGADARLSPVRIGLYIDIVGRFIKITRCAAVAWAAGIVLMVLWIWKSPFA